MSLDLRVYYKILISAIFILENNAFRFKGSVYGGKLYIRFTVHRNIFLIK